MLTRHWVAHEKEKAALEVCMSSAPVNKGPGRRSGSRQEPLVKGKTALRFTPSLFVGHIFSGRKVRVTLSLRVCWQKKRSRHPKSITLSKILCAHTGRGRSWRRQKLGRGLSKHLCCRKRPFIFSPRLTQTSVSWSSVTEQSGTASNKTSCWQRWSQKSSVGRRGEFRISGSGPARTRGVVFTVHRMSFDKMSQHNTCRRWDNRSIYPSLRSYPFQVLDSSSETQAVRAKLRASPKQKVLFCRHHLFHLKCLFLTLRLWSMVGSPRWYKSELERTDSFVAMIWGQWASHIGMDLKVITLPAMRILCW